MRTNPLDYPMVLADPQRITVDPAWVGHIPFAFVLVEMLKPATVVELGTYRGNSYCAFCQAVAALKLPTKCYAVDTWKGDEHTGHYAEQIYQELRAYHDPRYASFSTLLRMTFDEALSHFADGSVDLLHIDGLHTYEAVKHDYETWRPKLSPRGVVLFHDTARREQDFGVWKLWDEIRGSGPSFEFNHFSGLGVLSPGGAPAAEVRDFLNDARANPKTVLRFFETLGNRIDAEITLHNLGNFLDQTQRFLDAWKSDLSQPGAQAPINGHVNPYAAAGRVARDLAAVRAAANRV
jgi:hypothetical protein